MADIINGTYSVGTVVQSRYWSGFETLLTQIPNNSNNLVKASDVRDAVYTLWMRGEDTRAIAIAAASASTTYMNPNPTPTTVGGIVAGSSFPTPTTIQDMFDKLLYPYVGPTITLGSSPILEYGANPNFVMSWSVVKKSNAITEIKVDNTLVTPNGGNQTGNKTVTGTYSNMPGPFTTNTFQLVVKDGVNGSTSSTSATITWRNRVYAGTIDLTTLLNPNLTTNPGLATNVTNFITNLTGPTIGILSVLSITKSTTIANMNGGGNYLIFSWPSNLPGAYAPVFTINGLQNSAFTRVKTNWEFTNTYGFKTNYEVWISNTKQNSPLNVVIS